MKKTFKYNSKKKAVVFEDVQTDADTQTDGVGVDTNDELDVVDEEEEIEVTDKVEEEGDEVVDEAEEIPGDEEGGEVAEASYDYNDGDKSADSDQILWDIDDEDDIVQENEGDKTPGGIGTDSPNDSEDDIVAEEQETPDVPTTDSDEVSDGHEDEEGVVSESDDEDSETVAESDDDEETVAESDDEDEETVAESDDDEDEEVKATDESVRVLIKALGLKKESFDEVRTIFQAAVAENVAKQTAIVKKKYRGVFERKLAREKQFIVKQLDIYTESVVKDWVAKNRKSVEEKVRESVTNKLVSGIFKVLKEHNVTVPKSKTDAYKQLSEAHANLKKEFEKVAIENRNFKQKVEESEIHSIVENYTKGMTETNKHRFGTMLENFEFDSVADFRKKTKIIFENFYAADKGKKKFNPTRITEGVTQDNYNSLGLGEANEDDEILRYAKFIAGK